MATTPTPIVTYNGYTFQHSIMSVNEQILYADDESTQIGVRQDYTFSAMIIKTTAAKLKTAVEAARAALSEPRGKLVITLADGIKLIEVSAKDDINFGPKPSNITFDPFIQVSAGVNFTITVTRKVCSSSLTSSRSKLKSHTSTWEYTMDEAGYTTRTITGLITCFPQNNIATFQRNTVHPTPNGFKPLSRKFATNKNRTEGLYTQSDKEEYRALPTAYIDANIEYNVQRDMEGTTMMTFSGYLRGPKPGGGARGKQAYKQVMMARIVRMMTKFFDYKPGKTPVIFVVQSLTDILYDNRINFQYTAQNNIAPKEVIDIPGAERIGMGFEDETETSRSWEEMKAGMRISPPFIIQDACDKIAGSQIGNDSQSPTNTPSSGGSDSSSSISTSTVIIEISKSVKYLTDHKTLIFTPKGVSGAKVPIQTSRDDIQVLQSGFVTQLGVKPDKPAPIYLPPDGYVIDEIISPNAQILGGQTQYTIEYSYLIGLVTETPDIFSGLEKIAPTKSESDTK